jgi:hypothetical protein
MKNKSFKYISLLVVLVLLIALRLFTNNNTSKSSQQNGKLPESTSHREVNTGNEASGDLNRNITHLIYSHHARCRMDCRHISEGEIQEVLAHGIVNERKIETDSRGKTYPLEETVNGHRLRVVFAPKGQNAIEVVTCIDLDTEWQCDCH